MNDAMWKPARALLVLFLLFGAMPQCVQAQGGDAEQGTVYLIRRTGFTGAIDGYGIFMDGERICLLNNKKYAIHQVPAGEHRFSVRFNGKTDKEEKDPLVLVIEAGKTYYITVQQRNGVTSKVNLLELASSFGPAISQHW